MTRTAVLELASAEQLSAALDALPRGTERIALRVVLLPPLAQVRRIDLPRMTRDEAGRAVTRAASRWFPDASEPQCVAAVLEGESWIVSIAAASLIERIYAAAKDRGWSIDAIVPAHAVWAARAGDGPVRVSSDAQTTVVVARRGRIASVRRLPHGMALPAELAHARPVPNQAHGREASLASALDLVPERESAARARYAWRATSWLAGAAAALLLLAAGLTLWGERRELNALRAERARMRPEVERALASRDTVVQASERVTAISALEQSSPRWSGIIARIADALPADASLTAFRAEADSISLEGQARDAAGVFAAMRSTPGFVAVRASAPVRQEGGGSTGQPIVERFTMSARVGGSDHP